jgi:hypothetical protein
MLKLFNQAKLAYISHIKRVNPVKIKRYSMTAQKNGIPNAPELSDISVIRNILFGQMANEYESRIKDLEAKVEELLVTTVNQQNLIESNHSKINSELLNAMDTIYKDSNKSFEDVRAKAKATEDKLKELISKTSEKDKALLSSLIIKFGQDLIK